MKQVASLLIVGTAIVLSGVIHVVSSSADESIQVAPGEYQRITPDPDDCREEPQNFDVTSSATAAVQSPNAALPTPTVGRLGPNTSELDPATYASIEDSVYELVACFNAGEPLKALAFLTDEAARGVLGRGTPVASGSPTSNVATPMAEDGRAAYAIIVMFAASNINSALWFDLFDPTCADTNPQQGPVERDWLGYVEWERGRYRLDSSPFCDILATD